MTADNSTRPTCTTRDILIEQLDWHWTNQLRPRLDGLTDDEYLWEPVADAWSVRPGADASDGGPGYLARYLDRVPVSSGAGHWPRYG